MFGKLICFVKRKHLRGRMVDRILIESTIVGNNYRVHYRCDRCGARWTRNVKRIEKAA